MNRNDFLQLIGGNDASEYVPVACLLREGYGCAGYFNAAANRGLLDSVVLANARLVEFRQARAGQAAIGDFSEFIEEIVQRQFRSEESPVSVDGDEYGKAIPLMAIPMSEISVVYPVAKIGQMMKAMDKGAEPPAFLDFENKSIILKVLRTKLW